MGFDQSINLTNISRLKCGPPNSIFAAKPVKSGFFEMLLKNRSVDGTLERLFQFRFGFKWLLR
jgi:hypothetical protein